MEDKTMGNQQQNINFEIGYILGILDGEGSVTINKIGKTKTPPFYAKLGSFISITNTNQDIIDRCIEYLKNMELPFHVSTSYKSLKHKPVIRITVAGIKRCKKWIDFFKEYSFGKKNRFEILEEFILSRLETISEHPSRKPYSNKEIELFNRIRLLNSMGGKSRNLFVVDTNSSNIKERKYRFEKMLELLNKNWSQEKIAKYFGVDQSSISKWIKRNEKFINAQRLPSGLLK